MHRTHETRHVGGALITVVAVAISLLVGALGGAAQADDPATPSDTPQTQQSAPLSGGTTTDQATGQTSPSPDSLAKPLVPPPGPIARSEPWVVRRGYTTTLNVAGNDTCGEGSTCTYSKVSAPTGWRVSVGTTGIVTISTPAKTVPGRYPVVYRLTDSSNRTADAYVAVAITADSYDAPSGMKFTHPYRRGYRDKIRTHILRTINSVPSGARIQVASWSFASQAYNQALNNAKRRGVTVQIVLSQRNTRKNSDYRILTRMFGTRVTPTGSWVKKCLYSCRGRSGTMHSKIFLFSQVYRKPNVSMTGSANLTDFAVTNQWNQMNTVGGTTSVAKGVYDEAVRIFTQMAADRPVSPQYVESNYPPVMRTFYYPHGAVAPYNDFMLQALAPVRCSGAVNAGKGGHTIIKIAMYAWYQERGKWLAKRVRQLWNQGCQIQIVYAISSDPVKKILYSPSGRGRIPMRQILLTNKDFTPIYYLHDKWVTITGNYNGVPDNSLSWQGSFNFSDLGFSSDEQFQMLRGRAVYNTFARDFTLLWTDRQARAPSPISTIPTVEGRYTQNDLQLGTGVYRYMEAD